MNTFMESCGRIKFDLTGLKAGFEEITTWELRQILGSMSWASSTDFFLNGRQLQGTELQAALKPWR